MMVVFVLHSLGHQFFHVLTSQRQASPVVFGIIMFHLFSGLGVFMVDVATIWSTTSSLKQFQRKEDEDEKDNKKQEAKKRASENQEDDDDE